MIKRKKRMKSKEKKKREKEIFCLYILHDMNTARAGSENL